MRKVFKNPLLTFILGAIIFGGIGVASAAYTIYANNIGFTPSNSSWKKANGENITNVKDAIDDMYHLINENTTSESKKVCSYVDNTYSRDKNDKYSIGTKYECDPGDGVKRNFYILKASGDKIDLIMEQNIAKGTMTWYDAMEYFTNGAGATIKSSWKDVFDVDLPKVQDIADAVGRTSWKATRNNSWWCLESQQQDSVNSPWCYNNDGNLETLWLWDYTRECAGWNCLHSLDSEWGYGYWTRDAIVNTANAWRADSSGTLTTSTTSSATENGVRPVILLLKQNLSE